jgi:hypothetical protein
MVDFPSKSELERMSLYKDTQLFDNPTVISGYASDSKRIHEILTQLKEDTLFSSVFKIHRDLLRELKLVMYENNNNSAWFYELVEYFRLIKFVILTTPLDVTKDVFVYDYLHRIMTNGYWNKNLFSLCQHKLLKLYPIFKRFENSNVIHKGYVLE